MTDSTTAKATPEAPKRRTRAARAPATAEVTPGPVTSENRVQRAAERATRDAPEVNDAPDDTTADRDEKFGESVLDESMAFLKRFVHFRHDAYAIVATVWAASTWALAANRIAGRLAVLGAEPGCGKTHTLEMLAHLVDKPRMELDPTGPTVATVIALEQPTIMIDETDTIFGKSGSNNAKVQLRAILNSGYKRGATLTRKSGKSYESIPVFGHVAFGGMGNLPDTLMSRSFAIRMEKRKPTDPAIEAYRPRIHEAVGKATGAAMGEWVKSKLVYLVNAWPEVPDGLVNRAEEIALPLLAIADAAGGHWPADTRDAIRRVLLDESNSVGPSPADTLLTDIRDVWPPDRTRISTQELTFLLFQVESSPWRLVWDPIAASRELAALLATKGVSPRKVDLGGGKKLQGYRKEDFALAWEALNARAEESSGSEGSGGTGASGNSAEEYVTESEFANDDD
jgi:hypothetical protein